MSDDGLDALVAALETAGCTIKGKAVVCAFHGDRSASGSIYQSPDGRYRFKCHSCNVAGDAADIIAAHTGRSPAEVFKETKAKDQPPFRRAEPPKPTYPTLEALIASMTGVVEVYRYAHPVTRAVELAVIRTSAKAFPQAHPVPGGWQFGGVADPQPLYNRERVIASDFVVVVEGEKDVKALHALGIVATTAPMGADSIKLAVEDDGKPGKADWSPLAGKPVILWGDNDEPGQRHMDRVQRIVSMRVPTATLTRVRVADLGGHKDAADFIEAIDGDIAAKRRAVDNVLADAARQGPLAELVEDVEALISGKAALIHFPSWPALTKVTRALMPSMIVLLIGDPGAGKTLFGLQALREMHSAGIRITLLMLEDGRAFYLRRVLSQLEGNSNFMDPDWYKANPDPARAAMHRHSALLESFGRCIHVRGNQTHDEVIEWVEQQAKAGARVIAVDPITACSPASEKTWNSDADFMRKVKPIVERYGVSLLLVSHPKAVRFKGPPTLNDNAGGAAFVRMAQSILWLSKSEKPEQVEVYDPCHGRRAAMVNRQIRVLKARNGGGTGFAIGFRFGGGSLTYSELGIITETPTGEAGSTRAEAKSRADRITAEPTDQEDRFGVDAGRPW